MILPIMVAISASALASVPASWREGSAALGVNRWRTIWRVSLRTARPAIAAATVLATARALGEAIMLAMVSGGRALRRQPARRDHVPVRAGAAARRDDRAGIRRADDPARRAHDLRDRGGAARLGGAAVASPAGPPSSRSSATGSAPDGERRARDRRRRAARRSRARRAKAPRRGRWSTGSATGCAGPSASGCA